MAEPISRRPPDPRYDPEKVREASFDLVRRGFDQDQVHTFLSDVAASLRAAHRAEDQLRREIATLEQQVSDVQEIDEKFLTERLGEEAARILNVAREAATERLDAADANAQETTELARAAAADTRARADRVLDEKLAEAEVASAELRAEAESVVDEARAEAERILGAARAEAEQVVEQGRQQGRELIDETIKHRERMLQTMERRRRRAKIQVERLRAGRDRLLSSYEIVQRTLDEANEELRVSLVEAKAAADQEARRVADEDERSPLELEAELETARLAGLVDIEPIVGADEPPADLAPAIEPELEAELPEPEPEPEAELVEDEPEAELPEPEPEAELPEPEPEAELEAELPEPEPEPEAELVEDEPEAELPEPEPEAELVEDEPEAELPEPEAELVEDEPEPEPEAELPEPGAELVEDEPEPEVESASAVDSLFARLRRERADSVSDAEQVLSAAASASPHDDATADRDLLAERDALLAPIEAELGRALKRGLMDVQNELLDLVRRGTPGEVPDLVARFSEAVDEPLAAAWSAGATLAPNPVDPDKADLGPARQWLVDELTEPLRADFARALVGTDDAAVAIRAVARAARDERLAPVAAVLASAAFVRGIYDGIKRRRPLRLVADQRSGPCEHAERDVAAGPVRRGEDFPSGVVCPPVDSACRCIVKPVGQ